MYCFLSCVSQAIVDRKIHKHIAVWKKIAVREKCKVLFEFKILRPFNIGNPVVTTRLNRWRWQSPRMSLKRLMNPKLNEHIDSTSVWTIFWWPPWDFSLITTSNTLWKSAWKQDIDTTIITLNEVPSWGVMWSDCSLMYGGKQHDWSMNPLAKKNCSRFQHGHYLVW